MRKLLVTIGLAFAALAAYASPAEDLTAAFKAEQAKNADRVHALSTTQSVIRTYLATQTGLVYVSNSYIGYLVPKSSARSALIGAGFTHSLALPSQDILIGNAGTLYSGFMLLVYYDPSGNASEIVLTNTQLP